MRKKSAACWIAGCVREYVATLVVALCVLLVALINLTSGKNASGSLFDTISGNSSSVSPVKNKIASEAAKKNNLAIIPLSRFESSSVDIGIADSTVEYTAYEMEAFEPEPTLKSQIVLASAGPQTPTSTRTRKATKTHEVREGETASSIAAANGVSTSTILSANGLSETSVLKPGDKLAVLPVTGASHKVQKGDSLETIAKKYNVDSQKIITYNELTADGKLKDGQTLVIPDGYISPPATSTTGTGLASALGQPGAAVSGAPASTAPVKLDGRAGAGHRFPYGYCTWYVAQRRYVPWGGNAGAWLANAKASGKSTGRTPRPGAIVVTTESRWGHVALVESVKGSTFTISEMNYAGFGKKSTRTLSTNSRVVRGFIY